MSARVPAAGSCPARCQACGAQPVRAKAAARCYTRWLRRAGGRLRLSRPCRPRYAALPAEATHLVDARGIGVFHWPSLPVFRPLR